MGSDDTRPSGQSNGRKGKKRVGWQSQNSSRDEHGEDVSQRGPQEQQEDSTSHGAPDAAELAMALTRILSNEEEQKLRAHQQGAQARSPESSPPVIRTPRPVLKRDVSYDDPRNHEEADATERALPSHQRSALNDAKFRADRLAKSVGRYSHSAPGSRRNSKELIPSLISFDGYSDLPDNDTQVEDESDEDEPVRNRHQTRKHIAFSDQTGPLVEPSGISEDTGLRYRTPFGKGDNSQRDGPERAQEHALAEELVRFHTKKGKRDLFIEKPYWASPSGTMSPREFDDDAEYVPKPSQFRGGVLASLLKLQHRDSNRLWSANSSGCTTPTVSSTPIPSPLSTPSSSRAPSPSRKSDSGRHGFRASLSRSKHGSPTSNRPGSGLFYNHRSTNSASSLTLTELMKSSSNMFTAHASGEVSGKVSEKIRKDQESIPKSKKDRIKITVHIAGIIARHRYLMKLCRALMMYGAPTHRLEEYMIMSCRVLEIEGQFVYIPSCMIISFDDSTTHTTEVKVVREPQGIDLGKLRDVHNIYKEVVHDKLGVEEATKRLDEVMNRKAKFSAWFRVLMYGVASASVAPFAFEGRWIDLPVAFLLGCILGVLQLVLAPSNELYANVFEVTAAVITSFLARAFGSINNGELFCFSALAQSSIALILPGYIVLCGSLELQSHNIVSGSVRMVYAMIYTLFLGYGITIGASLYGMFDHNATSATHCTAPLDRNWYFLFVPIFTMCLCIVNQAKWSQTPVMLLMALAGFCVNSYSSEYFKGNSQISNMLGALTVGILANLYSRLGRHAEDIRLKVLEYWDTRIYPRFSRKRYQMNWPSSNGSDLEALPQSSVDSESGHRAPRKVGYSLAAAAMLPAIFVQVPSGLAAGGSLIAGITSANQITRNTTVSAHDQAGAGNLDGTAMNVLFSVIQVAIGISVGLFMSALIVYPLGKRRSGLFSF